MRLGEVFFMFNRQGQQALLSLTAALLVGSMVAAGGLGRFSRYTACGLTAAARGRN